MSDFSSAYLLGIVTPLLLVWFFLFAKTKSRLQMVLVSCAVAPLGLTEYLYRGDYWSPQTLFPSWAGLDVESVLYAFAIGGIASIVFEYLSDSVYDVHNKRAHRYWIGTVFAIGLGALLVSVYALKLNSMHATLGILIVSGIATLYVRPDLTKNALASGIAMAALVLALYLVILTPLYPGIFSSWWKTYTPTPLGIPLEELLFAFCWGFLAGPAYELVYGLTRRSTTRYTQ